MTWPPPLPNLPVLYKNETLYSWAGFVHAWNSNTDVRNTSRQLYGVPYAAQLHDFPSHLKVLDERLQHQLGSPRDLALGHTLLGYFLPNQEPTAAANILAAVYSASLSQMKFKLGIPASRVGGRHPLKGCQRCFDKDEADHGRAFWHVQHQFPSTLVCVEHRCGLQIAWDPITPVHRRGWILPRMGLDRQWVELPQMDRDQLTALLRVADFSSNWATLEPGSLKACVLAQTYQAALRVRDLVTQAGSLRLSHLVSEVRSHYAGVEEYPGFQVLKSVRPDWPGLVGSIARTSPRSAHPLKHLILIAMLFESWSDFLSAYQAQSESCRQPLIRPNKVTSPSDTRMDRFKVLTNEHGMSITAAAVEVGATPTTGVRWAKVLGIGFTPRTKSLSKEKLDQVRAQLQEGKSKPDIMRACEISAVSLNRLISSEPYIAGQWRAVRRQHDLQKNRNQFLAVVRAHHGWPVKRIRKIPGNGYQWLYRHDREWLIDHLPSIWLQQDEVAPSK